MGIFVQLNALCTLEGLDWVTSCTRISEVNYIRTQERWLTPIKIFLFVNILILLTEYINIFFQLDFHLILLSE